MGSIVILSVVDCNWASVGKFKSESDFCRYELPKIAEADITSIVLPLTTENEYAAVARAAESGYNLEQALVSAGGRSLSVHEAQHACARGQLRSMPILSAWLPVGIIMGCLLTILACFACRT